MNKNDLSVINLKGLSKPATKLIEAISDAAGILYEPTRIRRKAKAKADAELTLAKNKAAVMEVEARASQRLKHREFRRQENIEAIVREALDSLPNKVSEEKAEEDWIFQFMDCCQDVSNSMMQFVWAKILAGEIAHPGSFSPRTLHTVKLVQQEEAELFVRLCSYVWEYENREVFIISADDDFEYYQFIQLQTSGLVETNVMDGYKVKGNKLELSYFGKRHVLQLPSDLEYINCGTVNLSSSGRELSTIVACSPNEEYRKHVVSSWKKIDIAVYE